MTTRQETALAPAPPEGDRFAAARWLLDRHAMLRTLLNRVPGFIDRDGDPDVDLMAATISEYEQYVAAWTVYERRCPPPSDKLRFEQWRTAGPTTGALVSCISCLSASERAHIRVLATFATERVPISVADFASVSGDGRALLTDWTLAVRAS